MHEIERTAGGSVAGKVCENTQQNGRARLCRWSEYVSKCWKQNKTEQNKQVLTSWLRGPETLNKQAKGGGGGGGVVPMSFPCCLHCYNTLVAILNWKLYETWFYINLSTGAKRISNTIYHVSSPHSPPPPINLLWEELWKIMKLMSKATVTL